MFLSGSLKTEEGGRKNLSISNRNHMARMRACDVCSRRKIQCDQAEPQCNWCSHHGLECTFDRPLRKVKGFGTTKDKRYGYHTRNTIRLPQSSTVAQASGQVTRSFNSLPAQDSVDQSSFDTYNVTTFNHDKAPMRSGPTLGHLHFADHHLGGPNLYNEHGLPLFHLSSRSCKQSRIGADMLRFASPPCHNEDVQSYISFSLGDLELPARKTTDYYLSLYRRSEFNLAFPIVDTVLFENTVELAYRAPATNSNDTSERTIAKACVHSFLAVVSLIEGSLAEAPIDRQAGAAKAKQALPQLLTETSLDTLQVCYMQCLYHLMTGKFQTAGMFHSMACRTVLKLGGHLHEEKAQVNGVGPGLSEESWRTKKHLRRLFWLCYMADTDLSIRTDQPLAIDDRNCDLTLPEHYQTTTANSRTMSAGDKHIPTSFPGDIRLKIIKAKAIRKLYSAEALRSADTEVLRAIRELDDELEKWRLSLPAKVRPTLSASQFKGRSSGITEIKNSHQRMRFTVIKFEYLFTVACIHRATARFQGWSTMGSREKEAVDSSLVLSLEASRCTLDFLRLSVQNSLRESFWMLIFYPMSAVLTLFRNMLLNPLCPRARQDLELLNTTPELFKRMRSRHLTLTEDKHLNTVEDFIVDLTRLGRSAIEKAQTIC